MLTGTAVAQIITAASLPVVTRLYTPEMIGVISIYLSFFYFWGGLLTWRYESALLIAVDEEESHHVFRLSALLTFLNAILAVVVLVGLQKSGLLGFDILPSWAPLVAFFSLLGFGWFMLYRSWLLRLREGKAIGVSYIARSGMNASTRILTGALGFGVYGLFLAEAISCWAALGAVREKTRNLLKLSPPRWSFKNLRSVGIRYKRFAHLEMPSVAVNQLAAALPLPIIAMVYGPQAAGSFGLAKLLYGIPINQIGKTAGDSFQMEFGRKIREHEYAAGEKLFYKFTLALAVIAIAPLIAGVYVVPPLVPYVFGETWKSMGAMVALMSPWMFMALVVSSMSSSLSVLQKQHWKLVYDFSVLILIVSLFFYAKATQLELMVFISYLSFGMAAAYVVYFMVILLSVRSRP